MTASTRQVHVSRSRDHEPSRAVPAGPLREPPPREHADQIDNEPIDGASLLTDRLAYSVAEAALITGLSRDLLYDQMRTGKLPYLKVGRRRIITRHHLEAFLITEAS
jgi:excisionase family DNA binding protein